MGSSYFYSYSDPFTSTMDSTVATVLMVYLGIFLVIGIVGLASYIIKGFGMYRMAQREGLDSPWMAFVPFARTYLQGELSGDIEFKKRSIRNPGICMIILPIAGGVVIGVLYVILVIVMTAFILAVDGHGSMGFGIGIFVILMLLYILVIFVYQALVMVLKALVMYQILRKFTSNNMAITHAVLCNVIPLYESIVLFIYRNKPYEGTAKAPVVSDESFGAEQRLESESVKKPYVYSDSVDVHSQEPESYDVSKNEE